LVNKQTLKTWEAQNNFSRDHPTPCLPLH